MNDSTHIWRWVIVVLAIIAGVLTYIFMDRQDGNQNDNSDKKGETTPIPTPIQLTDDPCVADPRLDGCDKG